MSTWMCDANVTVVLDGEILECEVEVEVGADANHGADADGNRGQYQEFIEGFTVKSVENVLTGYEFYKDQVTDELYNLIEAAVDITELVPREQEPDAHDDERGHNLV